MTNTDQRKIVSTLQDLADALEDAARSGPPSIADWPHRQMDLRILARALDGLDHPVEAFGTLFPTCWRKVSIKVRDRIPGNPMINHKRLVARVSRAIGLFRTDIDAWSALRLLADMETPANAYLVGVLRRQAERDGLRPIDIDNAWIARQLSAVSPEDETRHRPAYNLLVLLSKRPLVEGAGLLRKDLTLPPTSRQRRRAVALPDWLQDIHDVSDASTRNGLDRVWRTLLFHDLTAHSPDDILALIRAGKLEHDAAQRVEAIKPGSWSQYIKRVFRALLSLVDDPDRYRETVMHVDAPREPRSRGPLREKTAAGSRPATNIVAARRVPAQQAARPLPAGRPGPIRTPKAIKPKRDRLPVRGPTLPAALCADVHVLLDLRGYTPNGQRAMLAALGSAYVAGVRAGGIGGDATLGQVVEYGAQHMTGRIRTDAQRMGEINQMCGHPAYRAFLAALRKAKISSDKDPTARLFAATRGEMPPSALSREWSWAHERSLAPCPRKTFSSAIEQLDALRATETLVPFLPDEPIGPLLASALRRGKRHQHARYPLPRRVEAEAAALGLDPDGTPLFEVMAGLHAIYDAARTAELVKPGQNIGCAELLCSATIDAVTRAGVINAPVLCTARTRTKTLWPDERYSTSRHRWRTLGAQVKAAGAQNPRPDGTGERIPGYYAVRREALEKGLGPEALTSDWARRSLARLADDRTRQSSFRQGLRLLQAWRAVPGIEATLLPSRQFDEDLIATVTS